MIKINNKMREYILEANNFSEEDINNKVKQFSDQIFSTIKAIDETVVIIDLQNEMEQEGLNHGGILELYGDYTGYEASCNDVRVNDYIDIDDVAPFPFVLRLFESLENLLKQRYPQFQFVLIASIEEKYITIRFHVLREEEGGWLSEDIDGYEEAILVYII